MKTACGELIPEALFGDNNWEKGEEFGKNILRQKTFVGDGGELERARAG